MISARPPLALQRRGDILIASFFLVLGLLSLYLSFGEPLLGLVVPLGLAGLAVAGVLYRNFVAGFTVGLAGYVILMAPTEGIGFIDAAYAAFWLGFIGVWFARHLLRGNFGVFDTVDDWLLMLFIAGTVIVLPFSFLYGAEKITAVREWVAILFILSFFPVKHAIRHYDVGPLIVLVILCGIGLFVGLRNFLFYLQAVGDAEMAWQVVSRRVTLNDDVLMVLSSMTLGFAVLIRKTSIRLLSIATFGVVFIALLLAMSRANWVAFFVAAAALFIVLRSSDKLRLVSYVAGAAALLIVVIFVAMGDAAIAIVMNMFGRLTSLQTAAQSDLSLVNRFYEARAAMVQVVKSPILGSGFGVPYYFFDLTRMSTDTDSFIHNGYLSLMYRFGIWGPLLILTIWAKSAWRGLDAYRKAGTTVEGLLGLGAFAALIGLTISALTANPFFLIDSITMFGLLTGIANGVHTRITSRLEHGGATT